MLHRFSQPSQPCGLAFFMRYLMAKSPEKHSSQPLHFKRAEAIGYTAESI